MNELRTGRSALAPLLVVAALCLAGAAWVALRAPAGAATPAVTATADAVGNAPDIEDQSVENIDSLPMASRIAAVEASEPERAESVVPSKSEDVDAAVIEQVSTTSTLVVVAEGSGEPLSQVDVYYAGHGSSGLTHPLGSKNMLATGESSPVLLRPSGRVARAQTAALIVGAPGYAWKKLFMDLTAPNERRVELVLAGSLRLEFDRLPPDGSGLVLLQDGALFAFLGTRERSATLTGLAPGPYRASLHMGNWHRQPAILGEREFQITAGQETYVPLAFEAPPVAITAALSGTVIVPSAWQIPLQTISLMRLTPSAIGTSPFTTFKRDTLRAVPNREGHYSFALPELETGRYSLTYPGLHWTQVFEHPPEGTQNYRFEIPAPKEVTVQVLLQSTNESPQEIERLLWHPTRPDGLRAGGFASAQRDPETGVFHLRVPEGRFTISTWPTGFAAEDIEFDTAAGTDFTVEVRRTSVTHLELRSEGIRIPWPEEYSVEFVTPSGETQSAGLTMRGPERWFSIDTAGSYQLLGPKVEGYLPPEPVTADLIPGEEQTVVFELIAQ